MSKYQVINPHNNELLYEYELTTHTQLEAALFDLKNKGLLKQKSLDPYSRSIILQKLAMLLMEHKQMMAKQIYLETGKLLKEALAEIDRGVITLTVAAEEAKRIQGETNDFYQHTPRIEDKISMTQRFPLGIVLCITPFNFPLNLALHKLAPAFAAGNCILFKPHESNYQFAKLFVDLCYQAGLPQECLKLIIPAVEDLNQLVADKRIDAISFTGGTKTADKIARLCGRKKLLFELGGNDALVIFEDANPLEVSDVIIKSRMGVCGQTCTSSKRIFVHKTLSAQIKKELLAKIDEVELGPLINEKAAKFVEEIVADAQSKGATILYEKKRSHCFYGPAIVTDIPANHQLIQEETFGPVICLIEFDSDSDVIQKINNQPYGLQAGIYTNDLIRIKKLFREIEVGSIAINMPPGFRQEQLPFGGVKDSGMGREGIKFAMEELSYIKQLIL